MTPSIHVKNEKTPSINDKEREQCFFKKYFSRDFGSKEPKMSLKGGFDFDFEEN